MILLFSLPASPIIGVVLDWKRQFGKTKTKLNPPIPGVGPGFLERGFMFIKVRG